ncbi:MAG: hypothetical protein AAB839_02150 [Patescibacteria group bacterium]
MAAAKPTVVLLTTHATLAAVYERHLEHLGMKVVTVRDIGDVERRAVKVRPALLLLDESSVKDAAADIVCLRKQPVLNKTRLMILCRHATSEQIHALHSAGSDDIMLTSHHTPRDIASRVQTILDL